MQRAARVARRASARRARSLPRTRCARASASSACRTRRSSCCSGRPATSPTARSSRRSTSCGGRTCCRTSSCSLAIGRRPYDDETSGPRSAQSLEEFSRVLPSTSAAWRSFAARIRYHRCDFDDPAAFDALADAPRRARRRATARAATGSSTSRPSRRSSPRSSPSSGRVGLDHERHDGGWRRVVIEKPFGHDLDSAKRLNREVGKVFRESQVYRIDHYLGKETVRNLLVFRFGNGIFEPLWNRRYVDHVQITVAESIGVENRGAFYEETGAVARRPPEPPAPAPDPRRDGAAGDVRGRRAARREGQGPPGDRARDPADPATRRRARPVRARLGRRAAGPGLPRGARGRPESETETFVAARLKIDDWRWAGVPFYVRTGKRLPKRATEIAIQFRAVPHHLFRDAAAEPDAEPARHPHPAGRGHHAAVRREGPGPRAGRPLGDDGLHLRLGVQRRLARRVRDAHPRRAAGRRVAVHPGRRGRGGVGHRRPDHRRLGGHGRRPTSRTTRPGTWGPTEADELLARDGRRWRRI